VFDGHITTMTDRPGERTTCRLRVALASFLAVSNASFAVWLFDTGYPLPLSAYEDPPPSVSTTASGGMRFDMCSHCGRGFALAGREPWPPMWLQDSAWVRAAWLANLPGRLVAKITGTLVEGAIGQYGAMWVETVAFALASTAQWALVGWTIAGTAARLVGPRPVDQQS
jgi:hypothetical protein